MRPNSSKGLRCQSVELRENRGLAVRRFCRLVDRDQKRSIIGRMHSWLGKELRSQWGSGRADDWWGLVKEVQTASEGSLIWARKLGRKPQVHVTIPLGGRGGSWVPCHRRLSGVADMSMPEIFDLPFQKAVNHLIVRSGPRKLVADQRLRQQPSRSMVP